MIPKPYIAKWQHYAPWKEFSQIEQDLIISRALVEIFADDFLKENLAFRGGTAALVTAGILAMAFMGFTGIV